MARAPAGGDTVKTTLNALLLAALLAATGSGCNPQKHTYAKVCADTEANPVVRVDDDKCDRQSTSKRYRWRHYEPQVWVPANGKPLPDTKWSYDEPSDAETLVRIPASGGSGYGVEQEK